LQVLLEDEQLETIECESAEAALAAGYVEGVNVTGVYRWAENQVDRLPALAADLVRQQVAVIVTTGGSYVALAAKAATTTIPIVFIVGDDPVRLSLVASVPRPGDNATGINFLNIELVGKRLELLRELVPAAARVAVLVNPADARATESTLREVEAAARAMGLQIQVHNVQQRRDRCGFRKFRARAARRPLRRQRRFLEQPTCPNRPPDNAPCDSCGI
jgi:ABC-type uncharacterized transport system substrate-binding protein